MPAGGWIVGRNGSTGWPKNACRLAFLRHTSLPRTPAWLEFRPQFPRFQGLYRLCSAAAAGPGHRLCLWLGETGHRSLPGLIAPPAASLVLHRLCTATCVAGGTISSILRAGNQATLRSGATAAPQGDLLLAAALSAAAFSVSQPRFMSQVLAHISLAACILRLRSVLSGADSDNRLLTCCAGHTLPDHQAGDSAAQGPDQAV